MVKYYDLNKPIPELNNLSLTQVFEDGNLFGHQDWQQDYTNLYNFKTGNYSHQGNHLLLSNVDTNVGYTHTTNAYTPNDKLYFRVKSESNYSQSVNNGTRIVYRTSGGTFITAVNPNINLTGLQENSIITINSTAVWIELRHLIFSQPSDIQYKVYENYAINLTSLGIDLTKEQMDYWFSIYQDSKGAVGSAFVQHAGIDTVIPNLNNKTLREVFESNNDIINGGLLLDNDNNGSPDNFSFMTTNLSGIENNIIFFRSSSLYGRVFQNAPYVTNNVYYYNVRFQSTSSNVFFNNGNLDELRLYHVGDGVMRNHSAIDIWGQPSSSNVQTRILDGRTSNFDNVYLEHMYKINLTSLGIDTLTQAEMDYYFSLYQSWKQKTLYIGKSKNLLLPSENETLTQNGVTLTNLGNNRYLINGTPSTSTRIGIDNGLNYQTSFFNMLANGYKKDININNDYVTSYKYISGSKTGSVSAIAAHSVNKDNTTQYIRTSNVILTTSDNSDFENSPTYDTLVTYLYLESGETFTNYIIDIQLEQRSFATNYEQYYTPKTWIAPAFQQHALTDTKLIDTKLAYLNGYSIREVFESNYYQWYLENVTGTYGLTRVIETNVQIGKYYIRTNYSDESGSVTSKVFQYRTPTQSVYDTITPNDSYLFNNTSVRTDVVIFERNATNYSANRELYYINLTALGIDHLTQAELDQMFALYQDRNKNLFDGTYELNKYINSSGALATSADWAATNYIPIQPNTTYVQNLTLTVSTATYPAFYDSNYNFISVGANNSNTYTSPANAYYLRTCWRYSSYTPARFDFQVELGTTATPYHAYGGFSLKDVFETGNLVTNGDFSDGTTGWTGVGFTLSSDNNTLLATVDQLLGYNYIRTNVNTYNGNIYYARVDMKRSVVYASNFINYFRTSGSTNFSSPTDLTTTNSWINYSSLKQITGGDSTNIVLYYSGEEQELNDTIELGNIYLLDLTTLNIANLTKDFMDDLYGAYSKTYQAPAFIDKYGVLNAPSFQVTAGLDTAFADLNGLTLREVFEDGNLIDNYDFSDGIDGWVGNLYGGTNILSIVNGNLFITNAGNVSTMFAGKNPTLTTTVGHKYYLNAKMRVVNRNASSLELGNGSWGYIVQFNPVQNQWYEMSEIRTAVATFHDYLLLSRYPVGQQTTPIQEVDGKHGVYAINLTALGINLTKEQMDWYFELYKTYKGGM